MKETKKMVLGSSVLSLIVKEDNISKNLLIFRGGRIHMKKALIIFLLILMVIGIGCENNPSEDIRSINIPVGISAPQNLTARTINTTQINLSWNPVEGASVYTIFRTTDPTWMNYNIISRSISNTTYNDTNLSPGTTYHFKVAGRRNSAADDFGELSMEAFATTNEIITLRNLEAPQNLTAIGTSTSQISLSWSPVTDANYYVVYRTTDPSWEKFSIISTNVLNTVYYDSSLSPGTVYFYKIGSKRTANETIGELSLPVTATTNTPSSVTTPEVLAAPENLTAEVNGRIITLTWGEVEKANTYLVFGSFSLEGTFVFIDSIYSSYGTAINIASMAYPNIIPLEPNTTYYFKVKASNGEFSSVVSATTGN
ncbi:MAG: fibronectin type III domain-containing protein [Treponema sp.]|nr:fibronectin type III domain-containing protein [Treponema sp.]